MMRTSHAMMQECEGDGKGMVELIWMNPNCLHSCKTCQHFHLYEEDEERRERFSLDRTIQTVATEVSMQ